MNGQVTTQLAITDPIQKVLSLKNRVKAEVLKSGFA